MLSVCDDFCVCLSDYSMCSRHSQTYVKVDARFRLYHSTRTSIVFIIFGQLLCHDYHVRLSAGNSRNNLLLSI